MIEFITTMLAITTVVWLSTEGVTLAFKVGTKRKLQVAAVIGPISTVLAYGAGLFSGLNDTLWSWFLVAFMGMICTLGAKALNDYVVNPLKKKLGS